MNKMKKYKSGMDVQGGIDSAARAEAGDVMEGQRISPKMPGVATSLRPKLRPKSVEQKAKKRKGMAEPKSPLRPRADGDFRAGGKVRGYGKARGGKACKMR